MPHFRTLFNLDAHACSRGAKVISGVLVVSYLVRACLFWERVQKSQKKGRRYWVQITLTSENGPTFLVVLYAYNTSGPESVLRQLWILDQKCIDFVWLQRLMEKAGASSCLLMCPHFSNILAGTYGHLKSVGWIHKVVKNSASYFQGGNRSTFGECECRLFKELVSKVE